MENNRAKQFMPFDALRGLREALLEKEKIIVEARETTEEEQSLLNQKIYNIKKGDIVEVVFYKNYNYQKIIGMISKIDLVNKELIIVKEKISFKDILKIK